VVVEIYQIILENLNEYDKDKARVFDKFYFLSFILFLCDVFECVFLFFTLCSILNIICSFLLHLFVDNGE